METTTPTSEVATATTSTSVVDKPISARVDGIATPVAPASKSRRRRKGSQMSRTNASQVHRSTVDRSARRTAPVQGDVVAFDPLTADDVQFQQEREGIVSAGVTASITTAVALFEIQQHGGGCLWRPKYKSMAEYARARWGFTAPYTSRLLQCGELVVELKEKLPTGNLLPAHERQVRPLLSLQERDRAEFWQKIVQDVGIENVTGKVVAARVNKRLGLSTVKKEGPAAQPVAVPPLTSKSPTPISPPVSPVASSAAGAQASMTPSTRETERQLRDQKIHTAIEALQGIANDDRDSFTIGRAIETLTKVLFRPLPAPDSTEVAD